MKKSMLMLPLMALVMSGFSAPAALGVMAEPDDSSVESIADSVEASVEATSEEPVASVEKEGYDFSISTSIQFRNTADGAYAEGTDKIGNYYLSADGWNEGDDYDIILNVQGNPTTEIKDKFLYIFEYKASKVVWSGADVMPNADKTFTLAKPAEAGVHSLVICFTREQMTINDLSSINWRELVNTQNLLTILAWVVMIGATIGMFAYNAHIRKRGTTTLQEVKGAMISEIKTQYGDVLANQVSELFDNTVKPVFSAVDSKLSTLDGNMVIMLRCLLLMQEDTPEARLAVTELLTKIQKEDDELTAKVKKMIEDEITKRDDEAKRKAEALRQAKELNDAYIEETGEPEEKKARPIE